MAEKVNFTINLNGNLYESQIIEKLLRQTAPLPHQNLFFFGPAKKEKRQWSNSGVILEWYWSSIGVVVE